MVIDRISLLKEKYIIVVEAKRGHLTTARKQCLGALKDMGDNNGSGIAYGFITTGIEWQMIRYEVGNKKFVVSHRVIMLFESMSQNRAMWVEKYSIVVDCLFAALSHGINSPPFN